MDDAPIRYGVIGTGMMGCEHLRNLREVPGALITAIADADERSRAFGKLAAGREVEVYGDHRELLARAPVDAVVVATPNFTHFGVLQDVFRTRKHVLVEKPLCTTVEDSLRVVEQAEKHPGVVWVGMEYRYMPPVARTAAPSDASACSPSGSTASPSCRRSATGTASAATPAAPWSRSAATSST
jgi:predicted dehydrogenase